METSKRGQWGSSFGFLMAAIGSAIGLGNLWAFPYKMGKTGGFAFLVLYLILVALVGVVGMLGEFALGRKTGKGAGGAYAALGKKYSFIGWMAVISPFLILSFYAVLGGMVLRYCLGFLVQIFGADGFAGQGSGFFGWLLYSGQSMILFFALFRFALLSIRRFGGIRSRCDRTLDGNAADVDIVHNYVDGLVDAGRERDYQHEYYDRENGDVRYDRVFR